MSIAVEDYDKVVKFLTSQVEALQVELFKTTDCLEDSVSSDELKLVVQASIAINKQMRDEHDELYKDYQELQKERDSIMEKLLLQLKINHEQREELKVLREQVKAKNEEKLSA